MNLLLDTHIFLWSLLEPGRLSQQVATELEGPANEIWISPITTWECLVLAAKGRIVLLKEPTLWVRDALKTAHFKEAPLNHEVALQSRLLELPYDDPADRFLAATAVVYDLTLVTADERLLKSRACSVLANT